MLDWQLPRSFELPRHKIYLTSLNQLIERKIVIGPEVETTHRIFPKCAVNKKLPVSCLRTKSSAQMRAAKVDVQCSETNGINMVVESGRSVTSYQSKR
jgi:hypothetical protein